MTGAGSTLRSKLRIEDCVNVVCPVTGRAISGDGLALYRGHVVGFADRATRDAFLGTWVALETAIRPAPRICAQAA